MMCGRANGMNITAGAEAGRKRFPEATWKLRRALLRKLIRKLVGKSMRKRVRKLITNFSSNIFGYIKHMRAY